MKTVTNNIAKALTKQIFSAICAVIFALVVFGSFSPKIQSADGISFSITDCEAKPDRVISPRLEAVSDKMLSAASFEIFYDSEMLEFREAKSENGRIEYSEKPGSVKLVYLSTNGTNISGQAPIITFSFKTIAEGDCYIDFTASDCIDSEVNEIEVTSCTAAEVSIHKNAPETSDGVKEKQSSGKNTSTKSSGSKQSSSKSSQSSKSSKSSESSSSRSSKSSSSTSKKNNGKSNNGSDGDDPDNLGFFGTDSGSGFGFAIAGVAIGLSASAISAVAYFAIKRRADKKKKDNKSETDSEQDEETTKE